MADLRIVDAPLLSTVKGTEKLPTGGEGNFSVSVNQVADFAKLKWLLATEEYVDNAVGGVQSNLNLHKNNESNPHNVTKAQVGLGNVDNTADLDKPVSNANVAALSLKSDKSVTYTKTEVDNYLILKSDKTDLIALKIASDGNQNQQYINDYGGAKWYTKSGGYDSGSTVKLTNGDIVKSTITNNIVDPNTSMTGWLYVNKNVESVDDLLLLKGSNGNTINLISYYAGENKGGDRCYYDSTKSTVNDGVSVFNGWVRDLSDSYISTDDAGLKEDGSNATVKLQAMADAIGNNFTVSIVGKHLVNKRIKFTDKSNTTLRGDGEISAKELRDTFIFEDGYGILQFLNCPYTTVSKGLKVTGAKKFWMTNVDPTQAGDSPISLKNSPHSLIEYADLSHSVAWGIVAENSPYTIAQFNKIDDIVRQSGINLVINGGQYCKTIGNTIANSGLYGIEWETYSPSVGNYSSGNVISDCSTGTAITGTSALEIDIVDDQINFCNVGVNTYPLLNARRVSINARGLGCFLALSSASVKNVTYENCNFDYSINKAWLQRNSSNFVLKYGAIRSEIYTFPDSTITSGTTIYIKDVAYSVTAVTTVSDSEFSPSITTLKKITLATVVASDVGFYPAIKTAVTQAGSKAIESTLTNTMLKYKNNTFTGYGVGISNVTNYPDDGVGREYYLKNTFINCDKWLSMPTSVAKGAYISGTEVIGINSITINSTVTLTQLKTTPIRVINPSPRSAGILTIPFKLDNAATRYKIVVSFVSGVTTGTVVIKINGVDSYTISQATWAASSTKVFEVYGIGNMAAGGHTLSIVDTVGDLTFTSYAVDVYVS